MRKIKTRLSLPGDPSDACESVYSDARRSGGFAKEWAQRSLATKTAHQILDGALRSIEADAFGHFVQFVLVSAQRSETLFPRAALLANLSNLVASLETGVRLQLLGVLEARIAALDPVLVDQSMLSATRSVLLKPRANLQVRASGDLEPAREYRRELGRRAIDYFAEHYGHVARDARPFSDEVKKANAKFWKALSAYQTSRGEGMDALFPLRPGAAWERIAELRRKPLTFEPDPKRLEEKRAADAARKRNRRKDKKDKGVD